jgi:hypothetical protein
VQLAFIAAVVEAVSPQWLGQPVLQVLPAGLGTLLLST